MQEARIRGLHPPHVVPTRCGRVHDRRGKKIRDLGVSVRPTNFEARDILVT